MNPVAPMTPARALRKLRSLAKSYDSESAHEHADRVLCDLLAALGHARVVTAFRAIRKWYG